MDLCHNHGTISYYILLFWQYVVLKDGAILVPAPKLSPYSLGIRSPQNLFGFFRSAVHLLKVSRVALLAKGSNVFLFVKHRDRSPCAQVLRALVYGSDYKSTKVFLASHNLIWHKGEVTLTLKLSQRIKSTNHRHKEGSHRCQAHHTAEFISLASRPGNTCSSLAESAHRVHVQCTPMKGRRYAHVVSAARGRLHSLRGSAGPARGGA